MSARAANEALDGAEQAVLQAGLVRAAGHRGDQVHVALAQRMPVLRERDAPCGALAFREANTHRVDTYDDFKRVLDENGGFVLAPWDGSPETEAQIKEETKATIRCIPFDQEPEDGVDMISGKPSKGRVVFARAY